MTNKEIYMDIYYKRWLYGKEHEPIESQINRAQQIIDEYEGDKEYFQIILDFLKDDKYVRIKLKNGDSIDITKIAYTYMYGSWFDIININHLIDMSILPEEINKPKHTFKIK